MRRLKHKSCRNATIIHVVTGPHPSPAPLPQVGPAFTGVQSNPCLHGLLSRKGVSASPCLASSYHKNVTGNFTNGTDRIRLPRISFLGSAPCRGQQEPVKTNVPDAALLRKNEYKGCSFLSRLAPLLVARSWVAVMWRVFVLN